MGAVFFNCVTEVESMRCRISYVLCRKERSSLPHRTGPHHLPLWKKPGLHTVGVMAAIVCGTTFGSSVAELLGGGLFLDLLWIAVGILYYFGLWGNAQKGFLFVNCTEVKT